MEKDVAELIIQHTENLKNLAVGLIALLSVNILGLIGRFWVEGILKNKDIKINKVSLLNEKKIQVQENLYHKLDILALFDPSEPSFFDKIQETEKFLNRNKLFVEKRIQRISHAMLDYFKILVSHPSRKNIVFEMDHLDMFIDEFSKL